MNTVKQHSAISLTPRFSAKLWFQGAQGQGAHALGRNNEGVSLCFTRLWTSRKGTLL